MKAIKKFGEWLAEQAFDNTFKLDLTQDLNEASLTTANFTPGSGHTYYGDKLKERLFAKLPVYLGKTERTKDFITLDDFDPELLKAAKTPEDYDNAYTSKRFITNQKKSILTQLFKGDFSSKTDETGEHITFGSGASMTHIQESVTAAILELSCNKIKIAPIPDRVPKKYQKKDLIQQWMISSRPSDNSGICRYVDFKINDDEKFALAMDAFLFSWGKSISKIYNSDARGLINGIFKTPITAKYWHFGHFQRKDQAAVAPVLKRYLDENRLEQAKDDIDKSDIVLYFSDNEAKLIMQDAMKATTVDEHNEILNRAFFGKRLLGISLKQVGAVFNLVGVNLNNAFTNVMGDEINSDKVIRVICRSRNLEKNTFVQGCVNLKNVKVMAKGVEIPIKVNNKESIHVTNDVLLTLRTKGTERINAILQEEGAKAFLGNAKGKFAKAKIGKAPGLNFDITALEDSMMKKYDLPKRLENITKQFIDLMGLPGAIMRFSASFASASGYSLETDNTYYQLSAPYIKIY